REVGLRLYVTDRGSLGVTIGFRVAAGAGEDRGSDVLRAQEQEDAGADVVVAHGGGGGRQERRGFVLAGRVRDDRGHGGLQVRARIAALILIGIEHHGLADLALVTAALDAVGSLAGERRRREQT